MESPKIIIKRPKLCSQDELLKFKNLVLEGGQVNAVGLDEKIKDCEYLGFCYVGNELASIAAIKNKESSYFIGLCAKASAETPKEIPRYELGYCFTNHHHRGKKYNSRLNDALLDKIKGKSIFATTAHDSMHNYFINRNFIRLGNPYDGVYNKGIVLYLKTQD
jgi:hypothetical protein